MSEEDLDKMIQEMEREIENDKNINLSNFSGMSKKDKKVQKEYNKTINKVNEISNILARPIDGIQNINDEELEREYNKLLKTDNEGITNIEKEKRRKESSLSQKGRGGLSF